MVVDQGVPVDEALLVDIAQRATLRMWPEGTAVAFTVEHELTSSMGLHVVRIVPAPSSDRWYLAMFDSLPPHVYLASPDRSEGVRVRPGSHPRIASMRFCVVDDAAAAKKVAIDFSEPVAIPPDDAISFAIGGQPIACDRYSATDNELLFTCPALTRVASVAVAVASDITARSGVVLPATTFTVDLSALPAADCLVFVPPL